MTVGERGRFLRALKTYRPHDGRPLPEGTHFRFYLRLHYTLLRRGEAFALTLAWVNFQKRLITIPAEHAKSGEKEEVALHEKAVAAIEGQVAIRGSLEQNEPVFGEINVRQAFVYAMKKAKITRPAGDDRMPWRSITPHHHARHHRGWVHHRRLGSAGPRPVA